MTLKLFLIACMWAHLLSRSCEEIKGQVSGLGFLLPHWLDSRKPTKVIRCMQEKSLPAEPSFSPSFCLERFQIYRKLKYPNLFSILIPFTWLTISYGIFYTCFLIRPRYCTDKRHTNREACVYINISRRNK